MGLIQTLPPTGYAVSLDTAKAHLRLETTADDAQVSAYIAAASEFIERATRTQPTPPASYTLTMDSFPPLGVDIKIPKPPLRTVVSITYTATDGTTQIVDSASYIVDNSQKPGRVSLKPGYSWPSIIPQANAVQVNYTAGYPDAGSVPYLIRQGILFLTAHYYEQREGVTDRTFSEVPLAVQSIIDLHAFPEVA